MKYIFLKELRDFFNTTTGYIVIISYLLFNGLFLWVFNNGFNILENGYSELSNLFVLSPWIFLFLIPAITMRTFAEEVRSGTIEILLTRPLKTRTIILGKFFASITLVALSLTPTFIYFISIYRLGEPIGNIDTGATIASYIGLLFLSSIYVAIGMFSSSLTNNQIIAFLLGTFLCFFFYVGLESFAEIVPFISHFISKMGINSHYVSISRGVLDFQDIIYFISMTLGFLFFTRISIQSRKW